MLFICKDFNKKGFVNSYTIMLYLHTEMMGCFCYLSVPILTYLQCIFISVDFNVLVQKFNTNRVKAMFVKVV